MTCGGAADCASTAYCSGTTCTAKKASGQTCASATECASGVCGGRCCNAGSSCTCTQPSGDNLLRNPGFDKDLSSWTVGAGPGSVSWSSGDYEGCPFSGSALVTVTDAVSRAIEQCVALSPQVATYNFNGKIRSGGNGGQIACRVDLYNLASCVGNSAYAAEIDWLNVAWGPVAAAQSFMSGGAASAKVSCTVDGTGTTNAAAEIDFLYLGPSAKTF
jgi:hypothetical protein